MPKITYERHSRTAGLIGEKGVAALGSAHVAVFGLGGVGSYVCEALARAGVGNFLLVDNDTVSESNINRQLIALYSTVGQRKTDVAAQRVKDIMPDARVDTRCVFFDASTADQFDFTAFDYVVDAIDCVSSKLLIIEKSKAAGVPVISCMGTGNKLHPELFRVADISKTEMCPLARVMRTELKKRGISGVKTVFSPEQPVTPAAQDGRPPVASISFVPSAAGLLIAAEVVRDLCNLK